MDATIRGKIDFLGKQNQILANTAADATNSYNSIITSNFSSKFWRDAGLTAGAAALLADAAVPKITISKLPELIAMTSTSTELATVGETTALASAIDVSTGAATGAAVAGGGAAISSAIPFVLAGIALYGTSKYFADYITEQALAKKGKKQLDDLSANVKKLKGYCNSMISQLDSAIKNLNSASEYISKAEKKIIKQEYKTKDSNLKRIRERQAEVTTTCAQLKSSKQIIECIKTNLEKLV